MSSPPSDSAVRIGDRYRLDERIGAGAMGVVWRATDELLHRTVALKELLVTAVPAAGPDALDESCQRLMREGRIGARLQHAHVISMFDAVVHDDRPWLVMEYLPSRSLAAVLAEKGPIAPREAAQVGWQVADGLAAAHGAGVVHRDVKPGNVLIAEDGRVKLTDFGVSRAVDDVQLTRTGLIAGTPAFLSPEVARGKDPTSASDVFALGATLYAAVEGSPPFGLDDNAFALLHRVATDVVPPPRCAGPLGGLLMRLLSPQPTARPTAGQARDALAAIARGRSVAGPPTAAFAPSAYAAPPTMSAPAPYAGPPTVSALARPARVARARLPVLLAFAAILLTAGGITVAVLAGGSPDDGSTPAALPQSSTTASAPPTTAPVPTITGTPRPTPGATAAPAAADAVAFVRDYYALLPGNTDAAFALLSPSAQAASNGRQGFDDFYGGLESVSLENGRSVGGNTVDATVVFVRRGGATSREPYRFVVTTGADDRTVIESFSRL